ncbi:hypothetical protein [Pedobacter frigoris]|uniref:Outer membrane protein beta-barrel domain-containing protein n=1 Tax=Pedobacter frigoris TaxID=2571272 RepID=A0A4V5P1U5_9SPHI|nr:hypothetical protein [Pedobacter frigoris]TKC04889.1 hypothetical protein FA047_14040 [Pedobacter frigoris]
MQPTEHMDPSEDELIAHIRQSLAGHEEAYVPGAWEKFNNEEDRKRPVLWIWSLSGAAAVLLICAGLFLLVNKNPDHEQGKKNGTTAIVKIPSAVKEVENPVVTKNVKAEHADVIVRKPAKTSLFSNAKSENNSAAADPISISNIDPASAIAVNKPVNQPVNNTPVAVGAIKDDTQVKTKNNSADPFLRQGAIASANNSTKDLNKRNAKWEMGLVLAPSFGNTKKLHMGYGVSMAYALSDKISLSSGIAYNEMAASKNVSAPVTMGIAKTKDIQSTEAKLIGIDIPLEIKYHVSKNVYANVGVSAFAVLDQKRNNTYLEDKIVQNSYVASDGSSRSEAYAVSEKVVEEAPVEAEIKNGRYLGFYNFSVGYKQKISKNNSVSIEPFMKLPMKEVTKENLRMLGTGVRLKFDF